MNLLLDFDSTIVSLEGLDELAAMVLADDPNGAAKAAAIVAITTKGMEGSIGFAESLQKRLELFAPHRKHVAQLVRRLHGSIDDSFVRESGWLAAHANNIWVISGGFDDWIRPVVTQLGLRADHVIANGLVWGSDGVARSYDTSRHLAQNNGKVHAVRQLGLQGHVVMVGDGMTDYQVRSAGLANTFVAYVAHADRPMVRQAADVIGKSIYDIQLACAGRR